MVTIGLGGFWPRPRRGRLRHRSLGGSWLMLWWLYWVATVPNLLLAVATNREIGGYGWVFRSIWACMAGTAGTDRGFPRRQRSLIWWLGWRPTKSDGGVWVPYSGCPNQSGFPAFWAAIGPMSLFWPIFTISWVWIWDPGDLLQVFFLLNCAVFVPVGVLLLLSGGMLISKFYKEFQYNHTVSTTIECLCEQCSLYCNEFSFDWSTDPLHA